MPWKMIRWQLVTELGWTLEQVDALSMGDYNDYLIYKKGYKRYLKNLDK